MPYTKELHDEIIRKSHERSLKYGIEKERVESKKILKGSEISLNIKKNQELIRIATPFIKNLYDILKGSGFLIILTDKDGCILYIIGDKNVMYAAEELNMIVGAYMDEKSIGTNAMGTAIKEDLPIQISAKEHFINAYHRWTCSAAPIHDNNGNIIGTLNLTGHSHEVHPHTLGLAVAAVMSIENQLKIESVQKELLKSYLFTNTIMNSISYGVLAVDIEGIIQNCNTTACRMLKRNENGILYKPVKNMISNWNNIIKHIKLGKKYENEEVIFKDIGKFSLSVNPIKDEEGNLVGLVLVMNEIQRILNLVNKYTAMRARYTFDDYIYKCDSMKRIISFAKDIADSPSTVLIQGESGTGKEILAQSIHNHSLRAEKPFVAVNCGAIPKNLIESELFGYEYGAFTGAKKGGRPGKFELANGGTLFLDEIGEMPLDMQVNLLRVLQEGYITRVGGSKIIPVNVRIIAATNKDLKEEINKGTFREDLYYRLIVIPITIPPLRERREDIKVIIEHFLKTKAKKLNKPIPNISENLMNKIMNYDWPGNIRELENFIENVVNLGGNTTFNIENKFDIKYMNNIRNRSYYKGVNNHENINSNGNINNNGSINSKNINSNGNINYDENINSENINSENINSENINSENINSENMNNEDINNKDINNKDINNIGKCYYIKNVNTDDIYLCNLEELEKRAIYAVLKKYKWNISKSAKILGISRNTLYLKMKRYCIENTG
ncbi:acetoin dehydrogenase operon transcriptional activator AcoR [Clostridium tepidiprofundi DSM 19306]|uniref:Acetoin dehydrogenase operon transcriptional activator AcoR n=1 Tax=Clostridium tepidiprofundi DSM 19306 TaxID=1121338 RepID=A0A151B3W7_9CLOT|nr:sigma 54-interacting transcriptional regulator [Clostridium tepidiprofundi]KYH34605.1 acetoin dehydrogenase operon transcriptional activator AcoR [Clostridium tepidiprofundi DSM 19306]